MYPGFIVSHIKKGSPAAGTKIRAGDFLFKLNNSYFYDILDYYYLCFPFFYIQLYKFT